MKKKLSLLLLVLFTLTPCLVAQELQPLPDDAYFNDYKPVMAPVTKDLLIKKGDKLAIIGDSITEQKMYSRIIETYLTACVPQLSVTCRQYGWGGEQAFQFVGRMDNDCLRFNPTLATTCYGMNDFHYEPYKDEYGKVYYDNSLKLVQKLKAAGARVVQGSPGTIGQVPWWQKNPESTLVAMNQSLCKFRNIGVKIAKEENVAFADVFVSLMVAGQKAKKLYGNDYKMEGDDGVHPDWAGHLVMAYAFLKGLGLDGEIGTYTMDLASGKTTATDGHEVLSAGNGTVEIKSTRFPFCATGAINSYKSIRSGMSLVPFNEELNRLTLIVKNASADRYMVHWGNQQKSYSKAELAKGINLAADFDVNPFSDAFKKVDEAVAHKQNYETHQIKTLFHGDEGLVDMDATVELSEKARGLRVINLVNSFKPVTHTIKVVAE